MGTRNITFVRMNGETKVAQYCQWDGYPTGQGAIVMEIIRTILRSGHLDDLRNRLEKSTLVNNDQDYRSYTGAPITSVREKLFFKALDERRFQQKPGGGYNTHVECVDEMLRTNSISLQEAKWLAVASRDAGPSVLQFLMDWAEDGMTFYTDDYVLNMPIEGDWQIEGVYVVDLDEETVTIAYHGTSDVFSFAAIREMSDAEIETAMRKIEKQDAEDEEEC